MKDPLGLLDWLARKSEIPIGKLNVGVRWGQRFEVIYDANGKIFYQNWKSDPELNQVSYGVEYDIFHDATIDPTLLPQDRLTERQATAMVKKKVDDLLKGKPGRACKAFLDKVLATVAKTTGVPSVRKTFEQTFKYLAKNVGFSDDSGISEDYGRAYIMNGRRFIAINFSVATSTGLHSVGYTAIHETLHAAAKNGLYSQFEIAQAAFDVGKTTGIVPSLVKAPMRGDSDEADAYNSALLDQIIFNACGRR